MIRKIIEINEEKCNGCGLCADACHEGAIGMKNGKAVLLRDDYCDGLGDCLPVCPTNAITFTEREAAPYDEAAVQKRKETAMNRQGETLPCGCPGSQSRALKPQDAPVSTAVPVPSQLRQWPVQIKLVPINAPYFEDAHLLVAADCSAFAYADFHRTFMKGCITLVGCPKLDDVDYSEKLTAILSGNNISRITVTRMEVPCCGGIERAVHTALERSGKNIPLQVVTLSTDGTILR